MFANPLMEYANFTLDTTSVSRLYIAVTNVTTPGYLCMKECDIIRVLPNHTGYVMARQDCDVYPQLQSADAFAIQHGMCEKIDMDAVFCIDLNYDVDVENSKYDAILPYLAVTVAPTGGWRHYLQDSGVHVHKSSTRDSFYFTCDFWGSHDACKTGWLSMPEHVDTYLRKKDFLVASRRAQLCVISDSQGNDLRSSTKSGMKQGLLMYLGNVSLDAIKKHYKWVDSGDTTFKLSLSLLLLCYVETMSKLRLMLYSNEHHVKYQQQYASLQWDEEHKKYHEFPVCTPAHEEKVRVTDVSAKADGVCMKLIEHEAMNNSQMFPNVDVKQIELKYCGKRKMCN